MLEKYVAEKMNLPETDIWHLAVAVTEALRNNGFC